MDKIPVGLSDVEPNTVEAYGAEMKKCVCVALRSHTQVSSDRL